MDIEHLKHFNQLSQSACSEKTLDIGESLAYKRLRVAGLAKLHPELFTKLAYDTAKRQYDLLAKLFDNSIPDQEALSAGEAKGRLMVPGLGELVTEESDSALGDGLSYSITFTTEFPDNDPDHVSVSFPGMCSGEDNVPLASFRISDMSFVSQHSSVHSREPANPQPISDYDIESLAQSLETVDTLEHICRAIDVDPDRI